jgi:hypothetical protein
LRLSTVKASPRSYKGDGAFLFRSGDQPVFWEGDIRPSGEGEDILISFWVMDYRRDATMRTTLQAEMYSGTSGQPAETRRFEFFHHIRAFNGDWALVEFRLVSPPSGFRMKLSLRNKVIPGAMFTIDELLIREEGTDIYQTRDRWLEMNNRRVLMR